MNETKDNKMVEYLKEVDRLLDQISTKGTDTMLMAQARSVLVQAFNLAKTLVIFDEDGKEGG